MVVTAAFGLLLSLLQALGAPPVVVGFVVLFVSLVGAGQMLLFDARQPRLASILVGAVGLPLMTLATLWLASPRGSLEREAPCAIFAAVLFGGGLGYLAGGVVAGVFLIMDAIERSLGRGRGQRSPNDRGDDSRSPGAADVAAAASQSQNAPRTAIDRAQGRES